MEMNVLVLGQETEYRGETNKDEERTNQKTSEENSRWRS